MRLSTSLHRNLLECAVGGLLDKFIARSRRVTLFFDDIIAEYVSTCEQRGRGKNLGKMAEKWGGLAFQQLTPKPIKRLPPLWVINQFGKKTWTNVGIFDDIHVDEEDNIIHLTTKNESITRIIGKNDFMLGFFNGTINAMYNSRSNVIDVMQDKKSCEYRFKLTHDTHEPITFIGKDKSLYDKLNYLEPLDGFTLKDAFSKGILQLRKGNKTYFRGKRLTITENTMFHLVGAANLLLDEVPGISYNFFSKLIVKESTDEQKLILLKNLLQIMGWGIIKIVVKNKKEILFEIKNPPYGLQSEKDNWHFLNRTILGYLWLLNKDFEISDFKENYKDLKIIYIIE